MWFDYVVDAVLSPAECDVFAAVLHLLGAHHPSLPHLSPGRRGAVPAGKTNTGRGCSSTFICHIPGPKGQDQSVLRRESRREHYF